MLFATIQWIKSIYKQDIDKVGRLAIYHPLGLLAHLKTEDEMIVALLHDVVEDYSIELAFIAAAYGMVIRDAVDAISRRDKEPYFDYIRRCCNNELARQVKKADLLYNIDRSPQMPDNDSLKKRYKKALKIIEVYEKD